MYMVFLIESFELTGSLKHNIKEASSTQNEEFSTKLDNIFKKCMYTLLGVLCSTFPRKVQTMANLWFYHSLNQNAQECLMLNF